MDFGYNKCYMTMFREIGIHQKGVLVICSVRISELIWEQPVF